MEVAVGVSDERRGGKGKEGKGGKEDEWIGGVNNFRRRANRFVFFFSLSFLLRWSLGFVHACPLTMRGCLWYHKTRPYTTA